MEQDSSIDQTTSIMTVHEVAEYLRLSDATIYQMARKGTIPVFRMGRSWRFRRKNIDAWFDKEYKQLNKSLDLELDDRTDIL